MRPEPSRSRPALLVLVPLVLHALAREADRGLGLVLRAEVAPDGLLAEVGRAMGAEGAGVAVRVALWLVAGGAAWGALAGWQRHRKGSTWPEAFAGEAEVFAVLLLRPAITVAALVAVAARASYPYAFTLPVALTQDWAVAQDIAALAALVAWRLPPVRLPAPRAGEVFGLAFLAYALLVPDWAWRWDGHPGNEPKYLRQAVALGHGLTFDAEGVSACDGGAAHAAARRVVRGRRLARSGARPGPWPWPSRGARSAARRSRRRASRGRRCAASRAASTTCSRRARRSCSRRRCASIARSTCDRGRPGRVVVSVLLWCALAALLVMALFLLVRDATGRAGLAAALAFGFALVPPFLFYFFQFYPEMLGALVMGLAFGRWRCGRSGSDAAPGSSAPRWPRCPGCTRSSCRSGWRSWPRPCSSARVRRPPGPAGCRRPWRCAAGLVVPTLAGLYLTALYNFAITGQRASRRRCSWPGGQAA